MDEKEAIYKTKLGDEMAFRFLYQKYLVKVYDFTHLYIASPTTIEEIVQDVFVKIWNVRSTLDENKNFSGFLFIVTRNLIFNHSRQSFNDTFFEMTVLEAVEETYSIEEELEASDLQQYIDYLIDMLPPRKQEVFRLNREQHLTYKEISLRLQISEKTVEHHISDTLKFLKKNMEMYTLFMSL